MVSLYVIFLIEDRRGEPAGGPVVKNPYASAGDMGLIPGLGRFTYCEAAKPAHHYY